MDCTGFVSSGIGVVSFGIACGSVFGGDGCGGDGGANSGMVSSSQSLHTDSAATLDAGVDGTRFVWGLVTGEGNCHVGPN